MANHAPTMTTIKPGVVTVKLASGQVSKYVVFGGFADVLPTGCTLLAESAVPLAEISPETLTKRIDEARKELEGVEHHEHRTKLEQYLAELTNLNGVLVAA
jgi:F-type H+-transporting ATPase subunit epsilon